MQVCEMTIASTAVNQVTYFQHVKHRHVTFVNQHGHPYKLWDTITLTTALSSKPNYNLIVIDRSKEINKIALHTTLINIKNHTIPTHEHQHYLLSIMYPEFHDQILQQQSKEDEEHLLHQPEVLEITPANFLQTMQ